MSESIEIDYNGRTVTFREDDDIWHCYQLNLQAKSLKALKRKIDKLDGEARRVSFRAIHVDRWGNGSGEVNIVMLAKQKDWERKGYSGDDYQVRVPAIWIMRVRGNQTERSKARLDECFEMTESNMATLAEGKRLLAEGKRIKDEGEALIAAIPRLTLDDITAKDVKEEDLDGE